MKAYCPNHESHKKFYTTAHVVQEWLVDEDGTFIEAESTLETTHSPNPENIWTCAECGAEAKFKEKS